MIQADPPSGAVAPLSLLPTVSEAYRTLSGNVWALARVAALPFILSLSIGDIAPHVDPITYRLIWTFGIEVPWTLMGVAWLHHLLLAPPGARPPFFARPGRRHLRFLGYALLMSVIRLPLTFYGLLADALSLEGHLRIAAYWGLYLALVYIALRFAFVYAAASVGENYSLVLAWRHTRGIAFNLFIAVGAAALLPWEIFDYLLGLVLQLDSAATPLITVAIGLTWHAGSWILEGTYLIFIAIAFRTCTGWVPPPDRRILERFE